MGVYLPFTPDGMHHLVKQKNGRLMPKGQECDFRGDLPKTLQQAGPMRPDIWFLGDEQALEEVLDNLLSQCRTYLPNWFARAHDLDHMLTVLQEHDDAQNPGEAFVVGCFGALNSPRRLLLMGALHEQLGQRDSASRAYEAYLATGPFEDVAQDVRSRLKKLA